MKYLRYFETDAEYEAFVQNYEEAVTPNVCYVEENDSVKYDMGGASVPF